MYTIKHAADQIGVNVSTLRAWERRYGIGPAHRTEAGYRLYDEESVRALTLMKSLIDAGWSVRQAAEEARTQLLAPIGGPALSAGFDQEALARAAADLDLLGLTALLDQHFSASSFEVVVDGWLLPALRRVGEGWADGSVTVAGEHVVAAAVARRLSAAYDAAGGQRGDHRVLIGLPAGARHELGLLAFATAARRAGLATTWLGADVPVADWVSAATTLRADAVVTSLAMDQDLDTLFETVAAISEHCPDTLIGVGGSAQDQAPEQCLRLGHDIGPAAQLLMTQLSN